MYNFKSTQIEVEPVDKIEIREGAKERFIEAISIRTISYLDDADFDSLQFQKFNDFLSNSYPLINEKAELKIFNEYSHLYKIEGQDPDLDPIVLMAHIDVVPIASLPLWKVHPFDEGEKQDTIYGRGTMDDKGSLISLLEATEQLLSEGFVTDRTIYIALGHDEEVSGKRGAVVMAAYLEEQGINAAFILDEGSSIIQGLIPGMDEEVALIGIAEKGYLSVEMEVLMEGGHSSMPGRETSIDVLSKAISKLKENPSKASMTFILNAFFDKLGPEFDFKTKMVLANKSIFKSLILKNYGKSKPGNALVRTTTSPTIFEAGVKDNVIPISARAVVNFRILPGENVETILAHVRKTIDDDRVNITAMDNSSDPSNISPIDTDSYLFLEQSIKEIYPNVLTAPTLVIAATDSRHYRKVSQNIYRFSPYLISPENMECYHGVNEHMAVNEYENAIRFYRQVILNAQGIK